MPHGETVAAQYFRTIREFKQGTPVTALLGQLVDLVAHDIRHQESAKALSGLNDIKKYLGRVQILLDNANNRSHKYLTEMIRLRRENTELALDLATHLREEETKAALTDALAKMDEFVAASIADLDAEG